MGDLSPELGVDGKAAVEGVAGASGEAEGELALEHKDGGSWGVRHGEKLEDEGT